MQINGNAPPPAQGQTPALNRTPGHGFSLNRKQTVAATLGRDFGSQTDGRPPWPNVSYQPDQNGANMRKEEQQITSLAGAIVGAVRFGGYDSTPGESTVKGYDYYSIDAAAVRSPASLNVIAGHKE